MCSQRTFALSQVGAFVVGIDAQEIVSLEAAGSELDPTHVDVARMLGADVPAGSGRRLAYLRGPAAAVVLGASVHLATHDLEACRPPPSFVASALVRYAIEALLVLPDGFAYILAPSRLPRPPWRGAEVT